MTPAARREAARCNIDLNQLKPTGIGGYIQLSDIVMRGHSVARPVRVTGLARVIAKENDIPVYGIRVLDGARVTKADVLSYISVRNSKRTIPHNDMRRVIAQRMSKSMVEAPQYTIFGEYDATALVESMLAYAEDMHKMCDVKPTYSDLFIKIVASALRNNEIMNSTYHEDCVEIHPYINIGFAVALEDGLIVPNIKNADVKPLFEITRERDALVKKARKGRLLPDDYTGGTFTITNLGQYPVQFSTPIINQPESAILGIGMLTDKVVPVAGGIGVRKMVSLSLTCDHRHIDGVKAAQFFAEIKRLLEHQIQREKMCNIASAH